MAESIISVLPHEIIIEILLKVPPKSLLKFTCVSKLWLELICTAKFIKNHLELTANDKEYSHHRIIFQESTCNFKLFNVPCYKSNKDEILLLLPPIIMTYNGLTRQVEVADQFEECAAFRDWIYQVSNMRIVVNIYSLRTDSWTTLHDQLHGIFIINHSADETWGCLELSVCGEDNSNIKLGVVGSAFCALFLPSRYYYF
ncbi:uncharacterized protein LOC125868856 [Solanum stenotomum]|uniref:uncharacterized protein LOC125868856 n=1 Tax=Solanum stenotomum TaxID=172797 RepID=UPI0020D0CD2A|nr:uncharacterized protein LOC125868856 [Solanum stenotomum]